MNCVFVVSIELWRFCEFCNLILCFSNCTFWLIIIILWNPLFHILLDISWVSHFMFSLPNIYVGCYFPKETFFLNVIFLLQFLFCLLEFKFWGRKFLPWKHMYIIKVSEKEKKKEEKKLFLLLPIWLQLLKEEEKIVLIVLNLLSTK